MVVHCAVASMEPRTTYDPIGHVPLGGGGRMMFAKLRCIILAQAATVVSNRYLSVIFIIEEACLKLQRNSKISALILAGSMGP